MAPSVDDVGASTVVSEDGGGGRLDNSELCDKLMGASAGGGFDPFSVPSDEGGGRGKVDDPTPFPFAGPG